jgi:hypothetical protein
MNNGYNPLRWKCDERGCFNVKQRPKIEIFAECLPGRIAFSDVDATVEVNGFFLFLEFKGGGPRDIPIGQRIYFERLTALHHRIRTVIVCCDAETMDVRAIRTIHKGKLFPWEIVNTAALKRRISDWAQQASKAPKIRRCAA